MQHGFEILHRFFGDEPRRTRFYRALDEISPNVASDAIRLFDQWWNNIRFSTYIASISEHDDKEDLHGRLSMWRAFGGTPARVAIVLRVPAFSGGAEALNLMFSPVAYLNEQEAHGVMESVVDNVRQEQAFLHTIDRHRVVNIVFNTLVAGVTCLKHEGFLEEREWRVIYAPNRLPSPLMQSSVEVIGGIPQIIYKLPLDVGISDFTGGIGPSEHA